MLKQDLLIAKMYIKLYREKIMDKKEWKKILHENTLNEGRKTFNAAYKELQFVLDEWEKSRKSGNTVRSWSLSDKEVAILNKALDILSKK